MPMRQCLALRSIWSCRTSQTTMANDYRALRLLSEHSGRDPSGLAEEDEAVFRACAQLGSEELPAASGGDEAGFDLRLCVSLFRCVSLTGTTADFLLRAGGGLLGVGGDEETKKARWISAGL